MVEAVPADLAGVDARLSGGEKQALVPPHYKHYTGLGGGVSGKRCGLPLLKLVGLKGLRTALLRQMCK